MNAFVYPENILHFGSSADRILTLRPGDRILAPAIRLDDGRIFYAIPAAAPSANTSPPTYKHIESRILIEGFRGTIYPDMLGFLATGDRFARPKHAARIASIAGQLFRPFKEPSIGLTPADLW